MAGKKGRQTPTLSVILDYSKSYGSEAKKYYEESGRKLITWQARLIRNIMGVDKAGLWVHQKFGFSVPRRNGKNEIIAVRELWGLGDGFDLLVIDEAQEYMTDQEGALIYTVSDSKNPQTLFSCLLISSIFITWAKGAGAYQPLGGAPAAPDLFLPAEV